MTFKNPQFGNTYSIETGTLFVRNQGDDVLGLGLEERKVNNRMQATITDLSLTDMQSMMDVMIANAGQLVAFTDHEGRNWSGFFGNDPTFTRGRGTCQNTVEFTFEGDISGQAQGIDN